MYMVPPPAEQPASRVYKEWKGNNVFFLAGRLIFGPDAFSLLATIGLIVAPTSVFCVYVAWKLIDEFPNHGGTWIMVIVPSLMIIDLAFLLLTAARDPGIIPRNTHPPEPEIVDGQTDGQTPPIRLPRTKNVVVNGMVVKSKYCDTCMLYRPPRCSHCSICNNCVQKFDHHCPWVGQCIGLRNYRFYFMFVSLSTLLCLLIHSLCWVYITKIMNSEHTSIWKAMIKTPASIALILYTFFSFWFVGGLTIFHLYLISKNQSTYENFRYRYEGAENPFDIGILRNFREVFFSKIPHSKNNFRAKAPRESETMGRPMNGGYGYSERGWKPTNESYEDLGRKDGALGKEGAIGSESADLRHTTHSRRSSLGRENANWNPSADINAESGSIGNSIRMILDDDTLKSRAPYDQD